MGNGELVGLRWCCEKGARPSRPGNLDKPMLGLRRCRHPLRPPRCLLPTETVTRAAAQSESFASSLIPTPNDLLQPTMSGEKAERRPMACRHPRDPCSSLGSVVSRVWLGMGVVLPDISTARGSGKKRSCLFLFSLERCFSHGLKS